ncbi:hypothetical protein [Allohahella marinimesophila]|uniref:hypothetical protein n=1 Tax=Allohahella marinimesophila TaxID=1054972 RepID=UPI0031DA7015
MAFDRLVGMTGRLRTALVVLTLFVCFWSVSSLAEVPTAELAKKTEQLKQDIVDLNRELLKLEEDVLYPLDTQLVVFLGVDENAPFTLESVELLVDKKFATSYLYSDREIQALKRGGVQRLHVGNLTTGGHSVQAVFNGRGADNKFFRSTAKASFSKQSGAKYLELRVEPRPGQPLQPTFRIEELR